MARTRGAGDDLVSRGRERRERMSAEAAGHHRDPAPPRFDRSFAAFGSLALEGASVSAHAVDLATGDDVLAIDERVVLPTAGVGVLVLLVEVSARMTADDTWGHTIVDKPGSAGRTAPGLWQHMQAPALPVADIAMLAASARDALAVNALLDLVGLDAVRARADALSLTRTAVLDLVRDERGPDDAPHATVGSAAELTWLMTALARGTAVDRATSRRVVRWLRSGVDLTLVGAAFGADPLSHRFAEHDIRIVNAVGIDAGVRCETGWLSGPRTQVAYAATVQFADTSLATRLAVHRVLRTFGTELLEFVA
ncbi:serine hydrolase [Marisediminicola sp. LYQ85]|uniref:serine hydrolase n=1 Tax=Marisediminicola sp. LYQ85 TaxID=3391062 RepID=UPI003983061B